MQDRRNDKTTSLLSGEREGGLAQYLLQLRGSDIFVHFFELRTSSQLVSVSLH